MDSPSRPASPAARRRGRPAALSHEVILERAIALLDRDGVSGLTLRGLAADLASGVGSIYWYVEGKDVLVSQAIDQVIGHALDDARAMEEGRLDPAVIRADGEVPARSRAHAEALTRLRRTCLAVYHQLEAHPWVAPQLVGGEDPDLNSLRLWDRLGSSVRDLGVSPALQFHAASSLASYVTGVAAAMEVGARGDDQPELRRRALEDQVARWAETVPAELTFVHAMFDQFRVHDEYDQFVVGLDLLLTGLRVQAEAARRQGRQE